MTLWSICNSIYTSGLYYVYVSLREACLARPWCCRASPYPALVLQLVSKARILRCRAITKLSSTEVSGPD